MKLKTYEEARARITKIADENTRIAACSALEARWFADLMGTGYETLQKIEIEQSESGHIFWQKGSYRDFIKDYLTPLCQQHLAINKEYCPEGSPEIKSLFKFINASEGWK